MILLLSLACSQPPDEEPVPGPDRAAQIEAARQALDSRGVETLRIGMAPYGGESEEAAWGPVLDEVGRALGVDIELVGFGPHGELEEALIRGQIDGAQLRPLVYVELSERHPMRLAAGEVYSGSLSYDGYIVTLAEQSVRDVQSLPDLAQTPFGFVHPDSCSGFLYPAAMLLEAGVHPLDDIDARFYSDHRDVISAVQRGEVLAGAVWSDAVGFADKEGPRLKVVAKTPPIPSSAWVLSAELPAEVEAGWGAAMASISASDEGGRELLAPIHGVHGFLPVDDEHFSVVRELRRQLDEGAVKPPRP